MKLFASIFLVVLIFEAYQCEPLFRGRSRHNDRDKKLDIGADVTENAMTRGRSEHRYGHSLGYRHRHRHTYPVYSPHRYQSYGRHRLGHTSYYPYYPRHEGMRQFRLPYGPTMPRGSHYHGIHHDAPQYRKWPTFASTHQVVYYGQQGKPLSETVHPTPLASAHQTPNGTPNSLPNGPPNATKNTAPNGTPVETPVENEEVALMQKLFSVTPKGIHATPAEPLANAE